MCITVAPVSMLPWLHGTDNFIKKKKKSKDKSSGEVTTNSITLFNYVAPNFQNATYNWQKSNNHKFEFGIPSELPVMKKSAAETATCVTTSRCI